jgi:hypothetical protein
MAIAISNFDDFERKFESQRAHAKVFAFFLFDERPSHGAIEKFAGDQWDWLDGQATAANMFFYFFLREDKPRDGYINPSDQVAAEFGIKVNQLPGIVLFSWDDAAGRATRGVYFPLKAAMFAEDLVAAEGAIADFFSMVQAHQSATATGANILESIEKQLERERTSGRFRRFFTYLGGTLTPLRQFPAALVEALAKGFADAIIEKGTS